MVDIGLMMEKLGKSRGKKSRNFPRRKSRLSRNFPSLRLGKSRGISQFPSEGKSRGITENFPREENPYI